MEEAMKEDCLLINPYEPDSHTAPNTHILTLGFYFCPISTADPWKIPQFPTKYFKMTAGHVIIDGGDTIAANTQEFVGYSGPYSIKIKTHPALLPYVSVKMQPHSSGKSSRITLYITNKMKQSVKLYQGQPIAVLHLIRNYKEFTKTGNLTERFVADQKEWNPSLLVPAVLEPFVPDGKRPARPIRMTNVEGLLLPTPQRDEEGTPILPQMLRS